MSGSHARYRMATLLLGLLLAAAPGVGAPIEGDESLIKEVLAAQEKSKASLQTGSMYVRVQERHTNGNRADGEAYLVWKGPKTYWLYSAERLTWKPSGEEQHHEEKYGEMIETETERICYFPAWNLAQIDRSRNKQYRGHLDLRPDRAWFEMKGFAPFSSLLDPEFTGEALSKYVIDQPSENRIVVERHYKVGGFFRFTIALDQGGNVIEYDTEMGDAKEGSWRHGVFEWEQHASGQWYLKRFQDTQSHHGDPDRPTSTFVIEVSDFDPAPEIAEDRFTFDSLKVPDGEKIAETDKDSRRSTYRLGKDGRRPK
mgnify:FL=1